MQGSKELIRLTLILLLSTTEFKLATCKCKYQLGVITTQTVSLWVNYSYTQRIYGQMINCTSESINSQTPLKKIMSAEVESGKDARLISVVNSNITVVDNIIFSEYNKVKVLHLNGNNIKDIEPDSFTAMPNLTEIELSNNQLTTIRFGAFNGIVLMKKLDLSHNKLTVLENINLLINLEELSVTNNNISTINENTFKLMSKLKSLNLQSNKITTVNFINTIKSLKMLNVNTNLIESLSETSFQNLPGLESLDLSNNFISNLERNLFSKLYNLTELFLTNNTINYFSNNMLHKSVQRLDLEYNKLESVQCDRIQGSVLLRRNFLKTICHFGDNTTTIDLSVNFITEIKFDTFYNLHNLTSLKISENAIKEIHVDLFENSNNLTTLLLDHNSITALKIGTFVHLNSLNNLDLSSNLIDALSVGIFTGLNNLKILNLAYNKFEVIQADIFYPIRNLEELYLHGNPLISLNHYDITSHLTSLSHISVHFEKIGCHELLQKLEHFHGSSVTVKNGEQMKGPNIEGFQCEPDEDTNYIRRHEMEFNRIRGYVTGILSLFFLTIAMFIILFISHVISWYQKQSKNKLKPMKTTGPSCSLTVLTEIDHD